MLARVMLAVNQAALQGRLRRLLEQPDVIVDAMRGKPTDLLRQVSHDSYDLVVASLGFLGKQAGNLVSTVVALPDAPDLIVIGDSTEPEERARLLLAGCFSVLDASLSNDVLGEALQAVLGRRRARMQESLTGRRSTHRPSLNDFVSASPAMLAFMSVVRRVVDSDASLLITGETGVGKERLARAVHNESPRGNGPFVAVNCGALPDTLLESELFGHEEGAFTGASRARRGWFEVAHRGTIFLDEIGEMPLHLQVKLLHVLQNHDVQRLGSERSINVDVRVMAATNRDLMADVDAGRFRRDLYYRLSVIALTIPPLAARREDIPSLVDDYINHFRKQIPQGAYEIADDALDALVNYHWPGNVRELINVIERSMLLCDGDVIRLQDLPVTISRVVPASIAGIAKAAGAASLDDVPADWLSRPLREVRKEVVSEFERRYLAALLAETGGRVGETARRAGIEPRSLFEKMKRHKLRKEDFRGA